MGTAARAYTENRAASQHNSSGAPAIKFSRARFSVPGLSQLVQRHGCRIFIDPDPVNLKMLRMESGQIATKEAGYTNSMRMPIDTMVDYGSIGGQGMGYRRAAVFCRVVVALYRGCE